MTALSRKMSTRNMTFAVQNVPEPTRTSKNDKTAAAEHMKAEQPSHAVSLHLNSPYTCFLRGATQKSCWSEFEGCGHFGGRGQTERRCGQGHGQAVCPCP